MKKAVYNFLRCSFFLVLIALFALKATAQDSAKIAKASILKNKIINKQFVFAARWATPMTGARRQLTEDYDFKINKDSLVAYLPYFGRSYVAPNDPTDVYTHFTSTHFTYAIKDRKKGGWDIDITFKDQDNIQTFLLSVFDNGTAYLNVTLLNSSPISYDGYIKEQMGK